MSPPARGQRVVARAAVVDGDAPLGADEPLLLEAIEGRIERPLPELQHVLRPLLDAFGDAPAVHRLELQARSTSMSSVPCSTSLLSLANGGLLSTRERARPGGPFERQGGAQDHHAVAGSLSSSRPVSTVPAGGNLVRAADLLVG